MHAWLPRWLLIALVAIAASLGGATGASAASGLPIATCFRPAQPRLNAAALLVSAAGFDCATRQAGVPSGDYWVRSAPLPRAMPFMASVRTASVWQRSVTLYVLYADGAIRRTGFTSATTTPHLRLGAIIDLPLPAYPAARPVRLLWHVVGAAGARGVVVGPRFVGHQERSRDDMAMTALYAAFGGMALGLFFYNLALWRALRQRFQPAYCAMLFCLMIYAVSSSGWIGQLTGMDNNERLRLNALTLALAAGAAIVFARMFFEKAVFDGGLRRASTVAIAAMGATTLLFVMLAPWHIGLLDQAMSVGYLLVLALVPALLWRAWRVRSPNLLLFAIAWGVPIAVAGVRVAAALGLVEWRFWIDNSTVPAMALEACLSGLAIAARIRLISRERDEARLQESVARLLADIDPLTGLLNRRAFLAQAIGRTEEQTLVIVDVDYFKRVNETIGHDGGDEVLRVIARSLQLGLGPEALVARLGGEEFAILAPSREAPHPDCILARLRAARMPYDLTVTASIGSCAGPMLAETDWQALYACADRALFEAKAAGRDRARAARAFACAA